MAWVDELLALGTAFHDQPNIQQCGLSRSRSTNYELPVDGRPWTVARLCFGGSGAITRGWLKLWLEGGLPRLTSFIITLTAVTRTVISPFTPEATNFSSRRRDRVPDRFIIRA